MRLFTRFYALLAVAVCSILSIAWMLPSTHVANRIQKLWDRPSRRLVVFGDSWSDNGHYVISPPVGDMMPTRDSVQGKVWTEWLCKELSCSQHDNFARSYPESWHDGYNGAIIDNDLLNDTLGSAKFNSQEPLADLKTQVDQWIEFEKQRSATSGRKVEAERNGTLFTVYFGLWDIWQYSTLEKGPAVHAIRGSMEVLFQQLDKLAEHWPTKPKVIMPLVADPTFLPGWHSVRTNPAEKSASTELQRRAVTLTARWNSDLQTRAGEWDKGTIYLFDTNTWIVDEIRDHQMYWLNESDYAGVGKKKPYWDEVNVPCVSIGDEEHVFEAEIWRGQIRCKKPEKYLFWDEMHLSDVAYKMIAGKIAETVNPAPAVDVHTDAPADESSPSGDDENPSADDESDAKDKKSTAT